MRPKDFPLILGSVTLRGRKPDDLDKFRVIWADPLVRAGTETPDDTSITKFDFLFLKSFQELILIEDNETQDLVGWCGFSAGWHQEDQAGFIEVFLAPAYWGRGIGGQVVVALSDVVQAAHHIPSATVKPDNAKSLSMLQKLGWTMTGSVREMQVWQRLQPKTLAAGA